jgi:hypothetical protein
VCRLERLIRGERNTKLRARIDRAQETDHARESHGWRREGGQIPSSADIKAGRPYLR